jgi:hypothetical protein
VEAYIKKRYQSPLAPERITQSSKSSACNPALKRRPWQTPTAPKHESSPVRRQQASNAVSDMGFRTVCQSRHPQRPTGHHKSCTSSIYATKYSELRASPPISQGRPLQDAPIKQPPGLSDSSSSRCQVASDTHKIWPIPCQPELDGGRQRGQDISAKAASSVRQPRRSMLPTPRSGTSP